MAEGEASTVQVSGEQPAPVSAGEVTPSLDGFGDIQVEISAVLGTTQLPIEQFLKLGRGAIVELEQHKDANIAILVNGFHFARGEVRVLGDKVGFAILELIDHSKDLE